MVLGGWLSHADLATPTQDNAANVSRNYDSIQARLPRSWGNKYTVDVLLPNRVVVTRKTEGVGGEEDEHTVL